MKKNFLAAQLTPWTLILSAQKGDASPALRRECLSRLFHQYRPAIICFFRQLGFNDYTDRDDLAQEFFLRFIEKDLLKRLDPNKGSLRAYLKVVARHFVYDVRYREKGRHALTGVPPLPSTKWVYYDDELIGSEVYSINGHEADDIFDRQWARNTLEVTLVNFRRDCVERGLEHWITVFERHTLPIPLNAHRATIAETATFLNMRPKQVENHLTRANTCFRDHLRKVIRMTVTSDAEVEGEMVDLRRILSGHREN